MDENKHLMRERNMNRKCIVVLITLTVFLLPACHKRVTTMATTKQVRISMDAHQHCRQTDPNGNPLPFVSIDPGDQVQWLSGVAAQHYTVTFSGANLPFPGNNTFDDNHASPGATPNSGDHPYASVTMHIGGKDTPCTNNPMDMGVHIN